MSQHELFKEPTTREEVLGEAIDILREKQQAANAEFKSSLTKICRSLKGNYEELRQENHELRSEIAHIKKVLGIKEDINKIFLCPMEVAS
jgi:regulator of replication initiation timing